MFLFYLGMSRTCLNLTLCWYIVKSKVFIGDKCLNYLFLKFKCFYGKKLFMKVLFTHLDHYCNCNICYDVIIILCGIKGLILNLVFT